MDQRYPGTAYGAVPAGEALASPPEEDFDTEAMRGSLQQMLADNLGLYVVCEFLVGTQAMTRKEGVLYHVGRSYLTLYEELSQNFIVCDIYSLKFVTFYLPGQRPGQAAGLRVPTVAVPGVGTVPAGPYGLGASGASGAVPAPAGQALSWG